MPKNISKKGFGHAARTLKFIVAGAAALGVSAGAFVLSQMEVPQGGQKVEMAAITAVSADVSIASVSPAQRSLEALGVSSVEMQKVEEPHGDYYIFFTDASSDDETCSNGEIVLAEVKADGHISLKSLSHDILPQMSPELAVICQSGSRGAIRDGIQREGNLQIAYYAVVDDVYLTELATNLAELQLSGDEWAARVAEEERANLKTTLDDSLWYNQKTYVGKTYQYDYDIPTYGCGLCATTVALDMLFAKDWDPVYISDLMKAYGEEHGLQYCVNEGTSYGQWKQVVQGLFEVNIRNAYSQEDVKQSLMEGKMVIAGNGGEVFNDAEGKRHHHPGHIICFYKTDGENLWAKDSAECGGPSVRYSAEDFNLWWWSGSDRMFVIERSF